MNGKGPFAPLRLGAQPPSDRAMSEEESPRQRLIELQARKLLIDHCLLLALLKITTVV